MKSDFDKLFVNCNKLQEGKAKRILNSKVDLSLKNYNWDVPRDLIELSKNDNYRFDTFIGLGRWIHTNPKYTTKFICITKKGEVIYLEPRIIEIMYNSIKEDKKVGN
jgi:hypothetical protein